MEKMTGPGGLEPPQWRDQNPLPYQLGYGPIKKESNT